MAKCGSYTGRAPNDRLHQRRRRSYRCQREATQHGRCDKHYRPCDAEGCDDQALVHLLDGSKVCPEHRHSEAAR